MVNIAWYARAGHLDLLPLVAGQLKNKDDRLTSYYICNTELEEEYLQLKFNVDKPWVIANHINNDLDKLEVSLKTIRVLENIYNDVPLVRTIWSTMFEQKMPENVIVRLLIAHIKCWKEFLETYNIKVLFTEGASILSTCAAWLVCKSLNIDLVSFSNIPLSRRIVLTSSWCGYYDGLEEKIKELEIDRNSESYRKTIEYIERMKSDPQKTEEAQAYVEAIKKGEVRRSPINSIEKIWKLPKYWKRYKQRRQYYLYSSFGKQLLDAMKFHVNPKIYKITKIFEEVSSFDKRYFLFPLHMFGESSNHVWMGLGYSDQAEVVRQVAACLPIGCKLYVKEHTANFGEKPISFYKDILKGREVKLIGPYEDTFELIKHSEGIVTLGSSVGYEAFLLKKPVIVVGEPWYRNLPGIYKARTSEVLADLLQNVGKLKVASDEEILKVVYALYDLSFEGVRYPHPDALLQKNINNFANAFKDRIMTNISNGAV